MESAQYFEGMMLIILLAMFCLTIYHLCLPPADPANFYGRLIKRLKDLMIAVLAGYCGTVLVDFLSKIK